MLCAEFEDRLTDYIEGSLEAETNRAFAEHALRCPVCHELLTEVKSALQACRTAEVLVPPAELEARILLHTVPEMAMTCDEFEEYLTDYLDGFLPAPLFHRWERHAALCERCTELPGQVVRAIGACYTYINEEKPVPVGLHERILQATLGTTDAEEVRAPLAARIAARLRLWLDPIVSPQLATVATMLLVCVLVLTNTVSADGSIGGMYRAGMQLAGRAYTRGGDTGVKPAADSDKIKSVADTVTTGLMRDSGSRQKSDQSKTKGATQQPQGKEQK
ncbi:MAG TPA: zf-HC2 domain-containing protein [Pyrinomonadaceae bacterium]|nr:zf-HC2 domain-containing protein [Pyrinomonadaceae bacterium]